MELPDLNQTDGLVQVFMEGSTKNFRLSMTVLGLAEMKGGHRTAELKPSSTEGRTSIVSIPVETEDRLVNR